jgi:hypothetical protein
MSWCPVQGKDGHPVNGSLCGRQSERVRGGGIFSGSVAVKAASQENLKPSWGPVKIRGGR